MKRILISALLTAGLCGVPVTYAGGKYAQGWGFAPDTSFYSGASLGAANQPNFDEGTSGAGKLFTGIRYRYIGGEISYLKADEIETEGLGGPGGRNPTTFKSKVNGLSAAAVAYMPLNARAELIGKLGATYWDRNNVTIVQSNPGNDHSENNNDGLSPLLGIGAQYQLYQNMHLRGEWERIFSVGEGDYETNIDLLTLGVSMSTL